MGTVGPLQHQRGSDGTVGHQSKKRAGINERPEYYDRTARDAKLRITAKFLGIVTAGCLAVLFGDTLTRAANDPPHTLVNAADCGNCHYTSGSGSPPSWMSPGSGDNTVNNLRCTQCHTLHRTHSAATTGSDLWGTEGGWMVECIHCHNPHYQMQSKRWGAEAYLAAGTVLSVGSWQPSTNDTVLTLSAPLAAEYQGYYLIPNTAYRNFLYRIKTLTSGQSQVTVKGKVGTGTAFPKAGPGTPYAIVYARNIKDTIQYMNPGAEAVGSAGVRMFRPDGARGPGDSAHTDDSVCYVCHTLVSPAAASAVAEHLQPSAACTACHAHDEGFRPSCSSCHGFPPSDAAGLVSIPLPTGSTTAGAHQKHATSSGMNYPCTTCHSNGMPASPVTGNNRIQIGFSIFGAGGGSYDGQALANGYSYEGTNNTTVTPGGTKQCSTIYCHGSAMAPNGGTDTSPQWDVASTAACGTCHGASATNPPIRGSHRKHVGAYFDGYDYRCSICHKDPAADTTLHVNNQSEVVFAADPETAGGTYSGSGDMLDAYGTCSNIYCHSTVQSSPPGSPPTYRTTPVWGISNSLGCSGCHLYAGAGFPPLTGSHAKHFEYPEPQECYVCHNWNNSDDSCMSCHDNDTLLPKRDKHANHSVDVVFAPKIGGSYSGTAAPGDAYGNCSNTYCHSNGTSVATNEIPANISADWGTGTLTCGSCHGYPPAYPNGSPKANSHQEHGYKTCDNCHYATTTNGSDITDSAKHANRQFNLQESGGAVTFTPTVGTPSTCAAISCHGGSTATWGTRINCDGCHGYPPVPGDGKNISGLYGGGKGVHVTSGQASNPYGIGGHILNSSSLDPARDVYGDTLTGYNECVKCHEDGIHGNGIVEIKISSSPWSTTTGKGLYIRSNGFGDMLGAPRYNGQPGDTSVSKSCSSIICHQGDTPQWSCPGGE